METAYYSLATKTNYNKCLNHFFSVNDVVEQIGTGRNIADIIEKDLDNKDLIKEQILPMVGALIRDKYKYSYDSYNVPTTTTEFSKITEETSKWTAIDIVMVYYNPNSEIFIINPKNINHWDKARELTRDQLIVVYAKHKKTENNTKLEHEAITAIKEMIAGKDIFINQEFIDQTVVQQKIVKKVETPASAASKRTTPKYSVLVTNELFHNGNVESWKKIIESFNTKFPDLQVAIFYDGELINDINALFKWGKVKNGKFIMFQVIGENIRGVSKLQKYLFEGASPRFEQFLKLGVGKVLQLF